MIFETGKYAISFMNEIHNVQSFYNGPKIFVQVYYFSGMPDAITCTIDNRVYFKRFVLTKTSDSSDVGTYFYFKVRGVDFIPDADLLEILRLCDPNNIYEVV